MMHTVDRCYMRIVNTYFLFFYAIISPAAWH